MSGPSQNSEREVEVAGILRRTDFCDEALSAHGMKEIFFFPFLLGLPEVYLLKKLR